MATEVRDIQKHTLPNGLVVITETMSHVRSVSVGVWVRNGSRREIPEENGLAHFMEHMVFKGTERRSAEAIAREMDSVGGMLDAFTSKEQICFNAKVLDEHLPIAFDVIADLVLRPKFDSEDVKKERKVVLEEIKMDLDNPEYLLHEIFTRGFWPGHPLGRPILGTPETVKKFNRDALCSRFQSWFAPDHLVITAAGNVTHERLMQLVEREFGALGSAGSADGRGAPNTQAPILLEKKRDLEQARICIGVPSVQRAHTLLRCRHDDGLRRHRRGSHWPGHRSHHSGVSLAQRNAGQRRRAPPLEESPQGFADALAGVHEFAHVQSSAPGTLFRTLLLARRNPRGHRSRHRRGAAVACPALFPDRPDRGHRPRRAQRLRPRPLPLGLLSPA